MDTPHVPHERMTFLSLGAPVDVLRGEEIELCAVAIATFQPTRLTIPDGIGRFYDVLSLKISDCEQLVGRRPVSALSFGDRSIMWVTERAAFDTCPAGQKITLRVRRNEVRPHSRLVRLVRKWLDLTADPPRIAFSAAMVGAIVIEKRFVP